MISQQVIIFFGFGSSNTCERLLPPKLMVEGAKFPALSYILGFFYEYFSNTLALQPDFTNN
jgi:hypothetical protein